VRDFETYQAPLEHDLRPCWWESMLIGWTIYTRTHRLGGFALWEPGRTYATRAEALEAIDAARAMTEGVEA
jgi:hypothetical protein